MCGIAGVYLLDRNLSVDLDALLDTMLDAIEHRGGDATGFVALGDEGVTEWQKAACGARDFAKYRRPVPKGTRTILAHTRWATQGLPAFAENNHPLRRGSFYAIHNGHVSNDHELFQLAGRERYGQVDSEAIPARLASLGKLGAVGKMMSEIVGAAAVAAVDEKKPDQLALARGFSSPLFVLRTKKIVLFGSTHNTVKEAYTKHVGKLPKRARIENVSEGTFLLFRDGKLTKSQFAAYSPPKVAMTLPNVVLPWKDVSTESYSVTRRWDSGSDMLDCDGCGTVISWDEMEFRYDADSHTTHQFCPDCDHEWEWSGGESGGSSFGRALDAEWAEVNSAVLEDGEAEDEQ